MIFLMISVVWLCHFVASYIYPSDVLVLDAWPCHKLFFNFSLVYVARYICIKGVSEGRIFEYLLGTYHC